MYSDVEMLLTAALPIAHQDAGAGEQGNTLTFNRRKQLVERPLAEAVTQGEVNAFCAAHAVPAEVWEALRHARFAEFVATTLVRVLVDQYAGGDGAGLFSGVERYEMLEKRLASAAVVSSTLQRLWVSLCSGLALPIHPERLDEGLVHFWGLSPAVQHGAVTACVEQARAVVSLARFWSGQVKLRGEKYAAAAGNTELVGAPLVTPAYDASGVSVAGALVADVPVISGNTLRHQVVRAPAWAHLCRMLGLPAAHAGQGTLPLAVEAIFVNGGNIRAGAKQPTNTFALAGRIRRAFPTLDLLGGVTDSFDLGESHLKVSPHLVCLENRKGLPGYLAAQPEAQISAFDLLDQITETRQATANGVGQMIRSFEVLIPGAKVYLRLTLSPWAQSLTRGALVCALAEYARGLNVLGGQTARGYGQMVVERLFEFAGAQDDAAAYEEYLAAHREQLVAWMADGTLGSGAAVCS